MEKEEITLKYYYTHISAGVTVKHVNIHTGELLSTEQIEGNEGSPYKTEAKEIEGYELVESKMPENAEGEMTKEGIEVVYYYQYPSKVTVEYIDILTNKKIAEDEEIQGYEGEEYKTEKKELEGYVYEKVEGQEEGKQGKEGKKVKYYYIHKSAGVEVKHKDIITGKEIAQKEEIKGNEGDEYSTAEKQIQGYDIVKSKMPQNSKGKMTKEKIEVVYYYQRPVKVIVKYLEEGTEKPLEAEEEIKGYEKDEYETQGKEIKYYTMQQEPENAKGKMEIIEGKNEIIVKYYYKKKPFNLKIENIIETITIDKKEIKNGTKFLKQEIMKVDYDKSKIELKYKIIVTNDGELSGRGIVIEELPKGLEIDIEKNPGWRVENGKVVRETKYLKPGEKEEYELILRWEKEEDSLGLQTLKSKVVHLENEAGFSVEEMRGNKDKADAIIALATGKETYDKLAIVTMIILIILAGYIVDIKIKNKR
jgi:hypothetical protein